MNTILKWQRDKSGLTIPQQSSLRLKEFAHRMPFRDWYLEASARPHLRIYLNGC